MSKRIRMFVIFSLAVVVALAGAIVITDFRAAAQSPIMGEWTASHDKNDSKISLSFERRSEKGHKNQIGQNYEFAELQGLTREQASHDGPVRFSLVREAGTIDFEGSFQNGKGSGTFRFTPSQAFVSGMKSRGFDFEEDSSKKEGRLEDRLLTAAALNITTALADDLTSAGFGKLGVSDLFKAAIFKVDSASMREMKATGFPNMGMEELVKARIFKIDAKFVSEAAQMGFDKEPFENLVKLRIFKVTPEFITEVRNEGLTNLSLEELVKLQIFKIDGEFIRKAKGEGVPINVERLVERRIGVPRARNRSID
jgi:hypothetical protein